MRGVACRRNEWRKDGFVPPDGIHETWINVKHQPSLNVKRAAQMEGSATPPFRAAKCFRMTSMIS